MADSFTTHSIREVFTAPFKTREGSSRFVIGVLLNLGSCIIPIVPCILINGYLAETMRQAIRGEAVSMPEWKNWDRLFIDGLKISIGEFLFLFPGIFILIFGYIIYFISVVFLSQNQPAASNYQSNMSANHLVSSVHQSLISMPSQTPPESSLFFLIGLLVFIVCLVAGIFLFLAGAIPFPAALAHMIANDRFSALFQCNRWTRIIKSDFTGYFIAWTIMVGLYSIITFFFFIFYHTIICCAVGFLIMFIATFYMAFVVSVLFGQSYREGLARLDRQ